MQISESLLRLKDAIALEYFTAIASNIVSGALSLFDALPLASMAGVGVEARDGNLDVVLCLRSPIVGVPPGASIEVDVPGIGSISVGTRITGRFRPASFRSSQRPVPPGFSIGPARFQSVSGTIGAVVHFDADPDQDHCFLLTCNHVVSFNGLGLDQGRDPSVLQPSASDAPSSVTADVIGTVVNPPPPGCRLVPVSTTNPQINAGDYALIEVSRRDLISPGPADDRMPRIAHAKPIGFSEFLTDHSQQKLLKIGRSTGFTSGTMASPSADFSTQYDNPDAFDLTCAFKNTILVKRQTGTGPFAEAGDSGALVVTEDGSALGLVFALSDHGDVAICPLDKLFADVGISFVLP